MIKLNSYEMHSIQIMGMGFSGVFMVVIIMLYSEHVRNGELQVQVSLLKWVPIRKFSVDTGKI